MHHVSQSLRCINNCYLHCSLWNRKSVSPGGCRSWVWPSSTCATCPALCSEWSAARKPTSHMWPSEEEREDAMLPWQHVNTSSSGTSAKERRWDSVRGQDRLSPDSVHLQVSSSSCVSVCFCPGVDPAGPEARGHLPLPLTWWHPHRRGLRGRRRANLQPDERREQRLLQRPQVCSHSDTVRRTGSSARHRLQGESHRCVMQLNTCNFTWAALVVCCLLVITCLYLLWPPPPAGHRCDRVGHHQWVRSVQAEGT